MIIHLPDIWIVIIDIILWLIIHLLIAYVGTLLPVKYINTDMWLFKERIWEKGGAIYENIFFIKKWKELLPDGSALFKKGFRKKRFVSLNKDYVSRFIVEVSRAELVHWTVILISPVFFLWNYVWAGYVMIIYAILANLPCILAQRYNRIRFRRIFQKFSK